MNTDNSIRDASHTDDSAHCLEPSRLDAARGLKRVGERWTLFGLSLEPEEWLQASPSVQAELGALYVPPVWRPDDPAVLHGPGPGRSLGHPVAGALGRPDRRSRVGRPGRRGGLLRGRPPPRGRSAGRTRRRGLATSARARSTRASRRRGGGGRRPERAAHGGGRAPGAVLDRSGARAPLSPSHPDRGGRARSRSVGAERAAGAPGIPHPSCKVVHAAPHGGGSVCACRLRGRCRGRGP